MAVPGRALGFPPGLFLYILGRSIARPKLLWCVSQVPYSIILLSLLCVGSLGFGFVACSPFGGLEWYDLFVVDLVLLHLACVGRKNLMPHMEVAVGAEYHVCPFRSCLAGDLG